MKQESPGSWRLRAPACSHFLTVSQRRRGFCLELPRKERPWHGSCSSPRPYKSHQEPPPCPPSPPDLTTPPPSASPSPPPLAAAGLFNPPTATRSPSEASQPRHPLANPFSADRFGGGPAGAGGAQELIQKLEDLVQTVGKLSQFLPPPRP